MSYRQIDLGLAILFRLPFSFYVDEQNLTDVRFCPQSLEPCQVRFLGDERMWPDPDRNDQRVSTTVHVLPT